LYNGSSVNSDLARLNSNGTLDSTFTSGGSGFDLLVNSLALQPDGKVLVGGDFTTYNGSPVNGRLARINQNGTIDSEFTSGGTGSNSLVLSLALQPDGKVLAGGSFATYNGISSNSIIRLIAFIPTTFSVSSTDSKIQIYNSVNSKNITPFNISNA
jgi:uncharacterized delta-60 repeat protein